MKIPPPGEIRSLHERHAPSRAAFDAVYTHGLIVSEIAAQVAVHAGLDVDMELVRAGALLHDIGVYRLYGADGRLDHAEYVRHGILGEELLRAEGLPEAICRFCSRHTGVGITREDVRAQNLPLPPGDYTAETPEERLIMYADKFHSKSVPPTFVSAPAYAARVRRFGEDKVVAFKAMCEDFGLPDLAPLAAAHGHAVV
ncbi:phosphohydrolase [Sphaerisporangium krabiense]|uniref:HD/PDEase domain-containing protein n=1 Tax=Sphaerisporangium krabiense TaxID=763782 RepID=A0A7W8Z9J2_9ACTN|nr:HD domain-containing protein [Sphaerisporangium krabiense]MBB5629861.1 uncharacterized protein [Sphaerisporangium krabiense]GII63962.1 phosphohydrolase [Sphaerisporangium krabiense]